MTIQELAEAAHAAYQSAPQAERWQAVAKAIVQKFNDRPVCASLHLIEADGSIVEHLPPTLKDVGERAPDPSP